MTVLQRNLRLDQREESQKRFTLSGGERFPASPGSREETPSAPRGQREDDWKREDHGPRWVVKNHGEEEKH